MDLVEIEDASLSIVEVMLERSEALPSCRATDGTRPDRLLGLIQTLLVGS